ncbi:MAG: hypothetical protein AAGA09_06015 [Pseudomonadota bacterium]
MSKDKIIDARPDQLKILKLENRYLKPMAETVLDKKQNRGAKMAAVAAVALAITALQDAPRAYTDKLALGQAAAAEGRAAVTAACEQCDALAALVETDAELSTLVGPLEQLFSIVQREHERMERMAKAAGAVLVDATDRRVSEGDKRDPLATWLTRLTAMVLHPSA